MTSMTVDRLNSSVTFVFPLHQKRTTTIQIPEGSKWTSSPHWHEKTTEYIRVIQGRLLLIIDGVHEVALPEHGSRCINKYEKHEFMRADCNAPEGEGDSGDVVLEEWVDPG